MLSVQFSAIGQAAARAPVQATYVLHGDVQSCSDRSVFITNGAYSQELRIRSKKKEVLFTAIQAVHDYMVLWPSKSMPQSTHL